MRNTDLINKKLKESAFRDLADDHFRSVFIVDGLASKQNAFTRMIETDGVSACVHFESPKISLDDDDTTAQKRFHDVSRVIAIDPGRVNIVYAEEKLPDGSFKTYKLTRGQYYETCGFKEANRLSKKWQETSFLVRGLVLTGASSDGGFVDPKQHTYVQIKTKTHSSARVS